MGTLLEGSGSFVEPAASEAPCPAPNVPGTEGAGQLRPCFGFIASGLTYPRISNPRAQRLSLIVHFSSLRWFPHRKQGTPSLTLLSAASRFSVVCLGFCFIFAGILKTNSSERMKPKRNDPLIARMLSVNTPKTDPRNVRDPSILPECSFESPTPSTTEPARQV